MIDLQIPVFLQQTGVGEKPEESAITEAELDQPMTVEQLDAELEVLNRHLEYHRQLAEGVRAARRQAKARHRLELHKLGERADEITENIEHLKTLRQRIYSLRYRARYEER